MTELEHERKPAEPGAELWLEPWHVAVLLSKRRSGKSTVMTVFAGAMVNQRIVFADVKCCYRMPGAYVARGVDELYACPPDVRKVHFIPVAVDTPGDRNAVEREWNAFFQWCFDQTDVTVVADECVPMPMPANGAPGMAVKYVEQGARNRNGLLACSGRWRGLMVALKSHANVIGIFPGGLAADELDSAAKEMGEDLEAAARELGCTSTKPLEQLRFLLAKTKELGPYACLLYLRDQNTFKIFQVPAELLDTAIAFEVAPA